MKCKFNVASAPSAFELTNFHKFWYERYSKLVASLPTLDNNLTVQRIGGVEVALRTPKKVPSNYVRQSADV